MSRVRVQVTLSQDLTRIAEKYTEWQETIREAVKNEFDRIFEALGIPGKADIELFLRPTDRSYFCRVSVHGRPCPFPDQLVLSTAAYILSAKQLSITHPGEVRKWLTGGTASVREVAEFLSLVCRGALQQYPSVLLGPEQEAAYLEHLAPRDEHESLRPLLPALARVIDLWLSIADSETVVSTLKNGVVQDVTHQKIAEDLFARLRPDVLEIGLPRTYLKALTVSDIGEHVGFQLLRDGLFYELGVHYPPFRFVVDNDLKPYSFWLKINDWKTVPMAGLRPDELLVNDTVDHLGRREIKGRVAINPASGNECTIVDVTSKKELENTEHSVTTWDPMEYIVIACAEVLRRRSACFMDSRAATGHLEILAQAFPALVQTVREMHEDGKIAQVLRQLLQEEISIRNLKLILEALYDFDYIVTDNSELSVFDPRLPTETAPAPVWGDDARTLAAFVRMQMKLYISHKYTKGESILLVYLLDPAIEKVLTACSEPETFDRDQLLSTFRKKISANSPGATRPAILTTISVRGKVRRIIEAEFPNLPVLAYQELSSGLNIRPIARISLQE